MSSKEVADVRHPRLDRRQIERGSIADANFFVDLLDSFPHDENDSDLEDPDESSNVTETVNNEEISSVTENDENQPSTSHDNVTKRKRKSDEIRRSDRENEWAWVASNFQPRDFYFDRSASGITSECKISENSPEYQYLFEFFDNDLIDLIVEETNNPDGSNVK